jgi:hypothetical protein
MGEMINAYKILVIKPEGKILLSKPRHRWEDNIRIDLKEIRWFHERQEISGLAE